MDESFRVRVDKVFGSLTETSNLSSLWCLTDDEIEKREWNRDTPSRELVDFDSKPCPPHIDGFFSKSPQTLDFPKQLQSDLEQLGDGQEPDDDNELDIRSGIGLDCTLDYEVITWFPSFIRFLCMINCASLCSLTTLYV